MSRRAAAFIGLLALWPAGPEVLAGAPRLTPLALPGGERGVGFDDLVYSASLGRVLAPAGRSGRLDLVDPKTFKVEAIGGFTSADRFRGGHGKGTTSADSGAGLLFATDRDRRMVMLVDPRAKKIVGGAELAGSPDYVRWVEPQREVWVTEPGGKAIEWFVLETEGTPSPRLVRAGRIAIADGPESLIVDGARGRAYTHSWHDATVAIDIKTHREVARWSNGCEGSRGIALDPERSFLFVGCEEGVAVVLDVAHGGARVGRAAAGKGVDIIAYSARLKHLYVPGGESATMSVFSVADSGALGLMATVETAAGSHCVAADPLGNAYVCDPDKGRLLVFRDKSGS